MSRLILDEQVTFSEQPSFLGSSFPTRKASKINFDFYSPYIEST